MAPRSTESPIWLSHHWPDRYDRCVTIGHTHVCRRCLVLYPLILVTAVLAVVLDVPDGALWAAWLLPLPLAVDWIGEHLGWLQHSPLRQVTTTAIAAPGFGIALAVHVESPFAPRALASVATYVVVLLAVSLLSHRSGDDTTDDWEDTLEQAEAERRRELERLLDQADAAARRAGSS